MQNQFSKTMEDYNVALTEMGDALTDAENNIIHIVDQIEDIDSEVSDLNYVSQSNQYSLSLMDNEIDYLTNRMDKLERDLKLETAENQQNVAQINELEEHVEQLYVELGVEPGNKLYIENDIKFEYPERMNISDSGLIIGDASNTAGIIFGSYNEDNETDVFITTWNLDVLHSYSETLYTDPEIIKDDLRDIGFTGIVLDEMDTSPVNGHSFIYWSYTAKYEGLNCSGVYGGWYCPQKNRVHYILAYCFGEWDSTSYLGDLLSSFRCHQ